MGFTLYRELKDKVQVQLKNNVQKNRNGEITIKCQNKEGADSLLKLRTLGDTPVEARVDQQLNSSQGVVKCSHFRDCSEKDMNSISGVIGAYQFSYIDKKTKKREKPGTWLLAFNTVQPPQHMTASCITNITVETYVPGPL